jgi:hypothetical protein
MKESSRMSHVMQIRRLRQQVERFIDADLLLPEDGQRLLAALDDVLAALTGASAARAEIAALAEQIQALTVAGDPGAGEGQPPRPGGTRAATALDAGLASAGGTDE